jgi:enoyl-CoA hydratase/carnithine racemase
LERDGSIAVVTFTRPDQMNTLNGPMVRDLLAVFDETDRDDAIRAVIVTGSGRAFCAGAALSDGDMDFNFGIRNSPEEGDDVERDAGGRITLRIFESLKPVIAAVNGSSVGIGVTMQLPMDVRIASTSAKFGFVFARRGIVLEAASSWFLPRIVGISTAMEWCCSGRIIPADEALQRGLVRSLHAPEELLPAAKALARAMTEESAPVSVALTRQMLWRMMGADHPMEAHRVDSMALQARTRSGDMLEGIKSFFEKRPARFADKVSTGMPRFFPWWTPRRFKK